MSRTLVHLLIIYKLFTSSLQDSSFALNQSSFDTEFGWNPVTFKLQSYDAEELVRCFEKMAVPSRKFLHFVFVGDSRVRQYFYSFVQLLPDYDLRWIGAVPDRRVAVHTDMDAFSDLLRVRISFRWCPFIDHDLFDQFIEWTKPPFDQSPTFLLIGLSVWYMLPDRGNDSRAFRRKLRLLEPRIRMLSRSTRILWLHQCPTLEMFGNLKADNAAIYTEKIERYNEMARGILKNSGVVYWNSGHRLATEYARSCGLHRRRDPHKYVDCFDYIHTGYVALNRATQYLANYLCNQEHANLQVDNKK